MHVSYQHLKLLFARLSASGTIAGKDWQSFINSIALATLPDVAFITKNSYTKQQASISKIKCHSNGSISFTKDRQNQLVYLLLPASCFTGNVLLQNPESISHLSNMLDANNDGLEQARLYRSKLANDSGNGPSLVGSYYAHNEAINEIVRGENPFTANWSSLQTSGLAADGKTKVTVTSQQLANETTLASKNPDSSDHLIGYGASNLHGLTLSTLFSKTCMDYSKKVTKQTAADDEPDKYQAAALATLKFEQNTISVHSKHPNGATVGSIMQIVKADKPATDSAALLADLSYQEAISRAEKLYADYNKKQQYNEESPSICSMHTLSLDADILITLDLTGKCLQLINTRVMHCPTTLAADSPIYENYEYLGDLLAKRLQASISKPDTIDEFTKALIEIIK